MASYLFCWFLLQLSFGAVLTGPEMLAFIEMSFPLFTNLTFHEHMALFKNGNEKSEIIAMWKMKNAIITFEWKRSDFKQKIFIDVLGETLFIWICNVDHTHSAKYKVIYNINTTGPEVELTILENKQLNVCLNSPPNTPKKIGKLTNEQVVQCIDKFLDDHPQDIKRHLGNLTLEQIGKIRKWLVEQTEHIKEYLGNLTGEQSRKLQDNHTEDIKEYIDRWYLLFLGLLIFICIIGMLMLIGIIILLCIPANKLSQDQVHTWLNEHPDFMDTYLGKLTEDQICMQIRNWMDAYPGLLKNKALDAHENDQVVPPTLDELSVTLTQHSGTGIDGNTNMSVSTQEICIASQHSDEDGNDCQAVTPTLVEPPVTMTGSGNEIDGNQIEMSARKTFVDSEISDEDGNDCQLVTPTLVEPPVTMTGSGNEIDGNQIEMSARKTFVDSEISAQLVKNDTSTDLTLSDLAVTWCGPVTGTEDNHDQLELYSTCNSPSSATFSVPGPSGIQPFNKDKQDANPAQDTKQDVRVDIEDSDSEDKCKEPLLEGEKGCK